MFELHPRLAADTLAVGRLPLCRLQLMNDARYPWLILVPERAGLREIHQLPPAERTQLIEEISACSQALEAVSRADKINVGALGNLVPQLHVHVIARRTGDAAWPGPVWGQGAAEPWDEAARSTLLAALRERLGGLLR